MSHYTVAVFSKNGLDDVDLLLAPYYESITVEPYVSQTKEQLIQKEKERLQFVYTGPYARWQIDPKQYEERCNNQQHIEFLQNLPALMQQSDEQLYQSAIEEYEPDEIAADGGILSTYNPLSKWDWYEIGGRWIGMLILKENCTGWRGSPGLMTEPSIHYDSALAADVDFEAISEQDRGNMKPYKDFLRSGHYTAEYMLEKYPSEEEYLARQSLFYTYAVITPDGIWHAPGDMGWWGMSSESPDQEREWQFNYASRFIDPAVKNGWYITIVDCHI